MLKKHKTKMDEPEYIIEYNHVIKTLLLCIYFSTENLCGMYSI